MDYSLKLALFQKVVSASSSLKCEASGRRLINALQRSITNFRVGPRGASSPMLILRAGYWALTATAMISAVGNGANFDHARDLAAWIGLVSRQSTTGGKPKLLGISKRGNTYLQTLLIHGARATMHILSKSHTAGLIQQGGLTRRLAVEEPIRAPIIEPHEPVPHDLQRHPANPRRIAAAPAVINLRQSQQPGVLIRTLRCPPIVSRPPRQSRPAIQSLHPWP